MFAVFLRLVVSLIWSVAVLGNLKFTDTVVLGRLNCWELEKGVGVFYGSWVVDHVVFDGGVLVVDGRGSVDGGDVVGEIESLLVVDIQVMRVLMRS